MSLSCEVNQLACCPRREQPALSPYRVLRKIAVALAGSAILACGLLLLVLPGPAFLVLPLGVAVLATEFRWARRVCDQLTSRLRRVKSKLLHLLR